MHRGQPDADWYAAVLATVAADSRELLAVAEWLGRAAGPWIDHVRVADDLFLYTLVDRDALPAGAVEDLAATLEDWGFQLSIQGRKLYAVPHGLGKGAGGARGRPPGRGPAGARRRRLAARPRPAGCRRSVVAARPTASCTTSTSPRMSSP